MLLTSIWMLEAKKSSSSAQAQTTTTQTSTSSSCTSNSQCSSHNCVNGICQPSSISNKAQQAQDRVKNFNGILINNATESFTAQFLNQSHSLIAQVTFNGGSSNENSSQSRVKKSVPMPKGTAYINIIPGQSNTVVASASVGMIEKYSGTGGRDLSYVVTNTNGQWKITMAQQAAESKVQSKK